MWDGQAFARKIAQGNSPWDLIRELAAEWHDRSVGEPRYKSRKLPEAFLKWHWLISECPALAKGNDDHLTYPAELDEKGEDGFVVFLVENQGVWKLGIRNEDLALPDPAVYWADDDGASTWEELNPRLSQFALQWAIYSTRFRGSHFAVGSVYRTDVSRLIHTLSPLSLPTWRFFSTEFHLFSGTDLIAQLDRDGNGPWNYLWMEARTKPALEQAMALVNCEWDSSSTARL